MFGQQLVNGIAIGGVYCLITVGYSMVYGIMRLMNFAHGDVCIFGTFITFSLMLHTGVGVVIATVVAMVTGGFLACAVEYFAYRPLRDEDRNISMITALGVAYIIQCCSEIFWGAEVKRFPSFFPVDTLHFFGFALSSVQLFTTILAVTVIVGLALFLKGSKTGKAILCLAQDIPTASLMGININKTITIVYFLGGVLGVVGMILYASTYNAISTSMGFAATIIAFTAAVLGGIGSLRGAVVGSFAIGIIQTFASAYVSTTFKDVLSFGLLIAILCICPKGIFGDNIVEKV